MRNYYKDVYINRERLEELAKTAKDFLTFQDCIICSDTAYAISLPAIPITFDNCAIEYLRAELSNNVTIANSNTHDCAFAAADIYKPVKLFISDSGLYDTSILSGIDLYWNNVLGERYTIVCDTRRSMNCLDRSMISVHFHFGLFQDITYDARNDIVHCAYLSSNYRTLKQFKEYIDACEREGFEKPYNYKAARHVYKMFKRIRKSWLAQHNPK